MLLQNQGLRCIVRQYKIFKVAMVDKWVVVVTGPAMHEELRKIPDTHASFAEAVEEVLC